MQGIFDTIKPQDIADAFAGGSDLWTIFDKRTVKDVADSVRTLRAIWKGAWTAADGDAKIKAGALKEPITRS